MTLVDLKVCRDLLDFQFEGYKLSLDSIPILQQSLNEGVISFQPDADEYSFIQAHMASNFNQLFQDPWSPNSIFFLDRSYSIRWYSLMQNGRLSTSRVVFELPKEGRKPKGNTAITFPNEEWAVVSDGNGVLYILNTSSRNAGEPWMPCHTHNMQVTSTCYLLDSSFLSLPNKLNMHLIVAHFCQSSVDKDNSKPFVCQLEWLTFSCGQNFTIWELKRTRTLSGSTPLLYVALDRSCDAIYVTSEKEYKFINDSEIPVSEAEVQNKNGKKSAPLYSYIQTPEDITVVFRLPQNTPASEISVQFQSSTIDVILQGKSLLKGELFHNVDSSNSTWTLVEERLEIVLFKSEKGLVWAELVKGNEQGEELMDEELVNEIHSRLAYLTSETEVVAADSMPFNVSMLEECDASTEALTFLRINGDTHEPTHKIDMGGRQWLFTAKISPNSLPILCLRHDVDGILWQPENTSCEGGPDFFKIEHTGTFSALGYVQASKHDKKFASCSPDFQYAIISDCTRHVYLYCQPENLHSSLELRNRRTGKTVSHVAKQYVMNLENCQEILGLQSCNDCIFVLSSKMLYAIKVCSK